MKRILTITAVVCSLALFGCEQTILDANSPALTSESGEPSAVSLGKGNPNTTEFTAHHPSQEVECQLVDNAIAKIPHGNGDGVVTDDETGPGGWRFNGGGRSFVTFNDVWNGVDEYVVFAGRSNVGANSGIINDYPEFLDLPQDPNEGQEVFGARHGELTLGGGDEFQLPGQDNGQVHINMQFVGTDGGDRLYEGCANTPQLTNFGFTVKEGGDFVQQEYFKAWARADADGNVTEYEWTEISTFNNTNPDAN
jgi:hypothetical protein